MQRRKLKISIFLACVLALVLCTACHLSEEVHPPDGITTALTEEQQNSDLAQYYHVQPAAPAEELLAALEAPLDESDTMMPDDIEYLFDPNYAFKNGYAVLSNGVAYAATETVMTCVTPEIYNFYYAWTNAQNDAELVYKIWYPGYHYTTYESGRSMVIVEDIGMGVEVIEMSNSRGANASGNYGMDIVEVTMANGDITPYEGGETLKSVLIHVKFVNDDGYVVDRCVAWFGCYINNGEAVVDLTNLENAEERALGMAKHSAGENANLAAVMLEVYEDNKDSFDMSSVPQKGKGRK